MKDVGNLDSSKFGLMISCGNLQVHKIHPCSLFFVQDDTVCMNLYKRACAPKSSEFTLNRGSFQPTKTWNQAIRAVWWHGFLKSKTLPMFQRNFWRIHARKSLRMWNVFMALRSTPSGILLHGVGM